MPSSSICLKCLLPLAYHAGSGCPGAQPLYTCSRCGQQLASLDAPHWCLPPMWAVRFFGVTFFSVLFFACAGPRVECPLGTFPAKVDTDSASEGKVGAGVSVPERSGKASGAWSAGTSVDWSCARVCLPGQLLKATQEGQKASVECLMPAPPRTP